MAGPNGTALLGAGRLLRVKYDTLTYTVETPDGETVALNGYKRGAGCPVEIEIEFDAAWAEWSESIPTDDERAAFTSRRYMSKMMAAERNLRRNLLEAVIPGLTREAAAVLAGDDGPWQDILVELGWWERMEPQAQEDGDVEGEAVAGDPSLSTGSPASPDSSPPTTASRSRTASR